MGSALLRALLLKADQPFTRFLTLTESRDLFVEMPLDGQLCTLVLDGFGSCRGAMRSHLDKITHCTNDVSLKMARGAMQSHVLPSARNISVLNLCRKVLERPSSKVFLTCCLSRLD